ncbi:MAG: Tm-1-like ATP-binding domain-containing protein [Rhizobiaceae bacterium]|nr:Tm-1-like ATP-binding domain-containing protein [Rhizobiaceae bacterium]
MEQKIILVIGTYDTKNDELTYICSKIEKLGGKVHTMDVSVLGNPQKPSDISKHQVAEAASSSIQAAIDAEDENLAMQIMAKGAGILASQLSETGKIDGMIALGGTMGTDLALEVACALPLGVPKVIVSTIAFSPLIPPERLAPDVQMILWAGGLYGLNSICKSSLSLAAGAVYGAALASEKPNWQKPMIGVTSLGKICLNYMVTLKPALEERGFEVAIFHSTGMGGRVFEDLASRGQFVCVMDFCMQEFTNGLHGSVVNSGPGRLFGAGKHGIPQIIAPGASDIIDFPAFRDVPENLAGRPAHAHNRLIASAAINPDERRITARAMADCLKSAKGPVQFVLPNGGIEEWDRPGGPAHDSEGLAAFCDEIRTAMPSNVTLSEIAGHINDPEFCDLVLEIFDGWISDGTISTEQA